MELLVYVRNYGGRSESKTVGASVGPSPSVDDPPELEREVTSLAEFRVLAEVDDPIAELRDAIRDVFARLGARLHGRPIYCGRPRSCIRVVLEPGFDTIHHVERELAELLAWCSPRLELRPRVSIEASPAA